MDKSIAIKRALLSEKGLFSEKRLLLGLALVKLALHLATSGQYGYFIDELYTAAAGKHLFLGLVDIPPLVPALSFLFGQAFGYSLFAIRLLPALAGAATVYLAGRIAKEMGGGKFAQLVTGLAVLLGPLWFAFDSFFAYDSIDQLALGFFFLYLVRALKSGEGKTWIAVGIAAAVALLCKYTILFLGFGMVLGLAFTRERKVFIKRGAWLGAGIFFGVITLLALWQWALGFPIVEYWQGYAAHRAVETSMRDFLVSMVFMINPATIPLWLLGLAWLFIGKVGKSLRPLGILFIVSILLFSYLNARPYMIAAACVPLFAAGAMALEGLLQKGFLRGIRIGYIAFVAATGIALAPIALPVFDPEGEVAYYEALAPIFDKVDIASTGNDALPMYWSMRFGWEEKVAAVARVYEGLSEREKKDCGILASSYGHAGAIDLLGDKYDLPPASSGHLSYWLWGPATPEAKTWICIGVDPTILGYIFDDVEYADEAEYVEYAASWLRYSPVYLCRKPIVPIKEYWPLIKHFD